MLKNYKPKTKPIQPVEPKEPNKEYEVWDTVKYVSFDHEVSITIEDFPKDADRLIISHDLYDYSDGCSVDVRFEKRKMVGVESSHYIRLKNNYEKGLIKYNKDKEEYEKKLKKWEEEEEIRKQKFIEETKNRKLKEFNQLKKDLEIIERLK